MKVKDFEIKEVYRFNGKYVDNSNGEYDDCEIKYVTYNDDENVLEIVLAEYLYSVEIDIFDKQSFLNKLYLHFPNYDMAYDFYWNMNSFKEIALQFNLNEENFRKCYVRCWKPIDGDREINKYLVSGIQIEYEKITNCFEENAEEFEIPYVEEVRGIGQVTFSDCKNLKCVTIPANIDYIESGAFVNCDNLEMVIFKNITRYGIELLDIKDDKINRLIKEGKVKFTDDI